MFWDSLSTVSICRFSSSYNFRLGFISSEKKLDCFSFTVCCSRQGFVCAKMLGRPHMFLTNTFFHKISGMEESLLFAMERRERENTSWFLVSPLRCVFPLVLSTKTQLLEEEILCYFWKDLSVMWFSIMWFSSLFVVENFFCSYFYERKNTSDCRFWSMTEITKMNLFVRLFCCQFVFVFERPPCRVKSQLHQFCPWLA